MAQAKHDSIRRRSLLGALAAPFATAAAPALPAPGFAAAEPGLRSLPPPDPIFSVIAAHARACAELDAHVPVLAAAEQAAWHAPRGQRRAANKRLKQDNAAQARFCEALGQATGGFAATVPHTLEGAAAALAYVRAHYAKGYPVCEEDECMALFASTEIAICRATGLPLPPSG